MIKWHLNWFFYNYLGFSLLSLCGSLCVVVECGFHHCLTFLGLSRSEAEFLSLMEYRQALRVLIKPWEWSAFVIRFNTFHLDDLSSREHVGKLDRCSSFFLILYDLKDGLLHGITLSDSFVISIALVSVLITTYKFRNLSKICSKIREKLIFITALGPKTFFGLTHKLSLTEKCELLPKPLK